MMRKTKQERHAKKKACILLQICSHMKGARNLKLSSSHSHFENKVLAFWNQVRNLKSSSRIVKSSSSHSQFEMNESVCNTGCYTVTTYICRDIWCNRSHPPPAWQLVQVPWMITNDYVSDFGIFVIKPETVSFPTWRPQAPDRLIPRTIAGTTGAKACKHPLESWWCHRWRPEPNGKDFFSASYQGWPRVPRFAWPLRQCGVRGLGLDAKRVRGDMFEEFSCFFWIAILIFGNGIIELYDSHDKQRPSISMRTSSMQWNSLVWCSLGFALKIRWPWGPYRSSEEIRLLLCLCLHRVAYLNSFAPIHSARRAWPLRRAEESRVTMLTVPDPEPAPS